jgi:L,D-transpeptidase ErfK/SrfK
MRGSVHSRRGLLGLAALGLPGMLAGCAAGGSLDRLAGRLGAGGVDPGGEGFLVYRARRGDSLVALAQELRLGYVELAAANPGVDPWHLPWGAPVIIPTVRLRPRGPSHGLLINVADMQLYHADRDGRSSVVPIGIGREGHHTPTGTTRVVRKRALPTWYPPAAVRKEKPELPPAVPPGPDNPLGAYALYLGWPEYLIHGTNLPGSIGRQASNGCIRLYEEHIARLFAAVPVGTRVSVVHEPIKLMLIEGELYAEAHPSRAQATEIEDRRAFTPEVPPGTMERIKKAAGPAAARVDWELAKRVVLERKGLATRLTLA